MKKRLASAVLLSGLIMAAGTALAADTDNLSFTGVLKIPNCVINNNSPVEVDFGDIEIQSLSQPNAMYHPRDVDIPVQCAYRLGTPKLIMSSQRTYSATRGALKTSKYEEGGLVVTVSKKGGNEVLPFNTPQDVTNSIDGNTLTLNFALVRLSTHPMSDLTTGAFDATANMTLKYE